MLLLRHKLALVAVAIAVAAIAGGAYAATQSSAPTSRQAFLDDVAKRLGVSSATLTSALQGAYADRLSALVAAGGLSRAQANAIEQRLEHGGAAPMLRGFAPGMGFSVIGVGGGLRSHRIGSIMGGRVAPMRGAGPRAYGLGGLGIRRGAKAAAAYLGLSTTALLAELRSGRSLAQIASAHGKTADGLERALVTAITAQLDRMLAAKLVTSAQEQRLLSRLPSMLGALIRTTPSQLRVAGMGGWRAVGPGPAGHP